MFIQRSLLLSTLAALALQTACIAEPGKQVVEQLVTLFSAYSADNTSNRNIFSAATKYIDYPAMAQLMFKPEQWANLSPFEQRDISNSFRKLVENRYYKRWHKMFNRGKLTITHEAKAGRDIYVKSFLAMPGSDDEADSVIWRVRERNGNPVVVSINVNGKDLVARVGPRFQKALARKGSAGLVAWIRDKADDEVGELTDSEEYTELSNDNRPKLR